MLNIPGVEMEGRVCGKYDRDRDRFLAPPNELRNLDIIHLSLKKLTEITSVGQYTVPMVKPNGIWFSIRSAVSNHIDLTATDPPAGPENQPPVQEIHRFFAWDEWAWGAWESGEDNDIIYQEEEFQKLQERGNGEESGEERNSQRERSGLRKSQREEEEEVVYGFNYKISLSPDSRIAWLKNDRDVEEFTLLYGEEKERTFKDVDTRLPVKFVISHIFWDKVAEDYQGFIVAPYKITVEKRIPKTWYSSLDCASGAIWDVEAIEDIRFVKEDRRDFPLSKSQVFLWSYIDSRMLRYFALGGDSNPDAYDLSKAGLSKPIFDALFEFQTVLEYFQEVVGGNHTACEQMAEIYASHSAEYWLALANRWKEEKEEK